MKRLLIGVTAMLALAVGTQSDAQERAGVVTTLEGSVTVMRASLAEPAPLKFRDDIFVKDRVATGADSVARILLGGKAIVTVREHSVVTITEAPGLSTIDVTAGRAAVAVAREKMRTGDLIEVKTPNAVAGIRGTVIVAEVLDTDHSVITVLKGVIDVKRLDGGRVVGQPTVLRALQRVTVAGRAPVPAPQSVSTDAAKQLGQEFRMAPPRPTPSPVTAAINEVQMERAARHLARLSALPASRRGDRDYDVDDDEGVREALRDGEELDRDADDNAKRARKLWRSQRANRSGDDGDRGGNKGETVSSTVKPSVPNAAAAISAAGQALKQNMRGKYKYKNRD